MKRQAIFSCLTCVPSGNAGVCTACSLSCHDGHEVVELWTKRKFRCDCGNSKFGEFSCKLHPDKEPENTGNSYNQNFRGCYCTCGRPYPDPDAKEQIEMIQCCICEDWFHENHLGLNSLDKIPRDEDGEPVYDDFVCEKCASIFSFLKLYPSSIWALPKQKNVPSVQSGTENMVENGSSTNCSDKAIGSHISQSVIHESSSGNDSTCENGTVINATSDNNKVCLEDQGSSATCTIGVDINVLSVSSEKIGPMFLLKKWRELLCKCRTCSEFYTHKGVEFLTDKEDTIEEYEKMAKSKREEKLKQQEGAELNFLNTLNHVQKIEIFSGIADMKNELHSFLESFDSSKPVTSDDIKGVFENLAKKKKQRLA
ncbi:putative E3 ubiquitin-protein ligase UBR7 isoform X2 [Zingiber officinale]|nr:putative E3 ubiquitin-protein ligase UBR7 isoform X2 [Zingiber officinale]